MPLYLDEQTRAWLERAVKNVKDTDFIGKRIQKKLVADRNRLEAIRNCEHIPAEYIGKKTCCSKCGSHYEPGMGEEWRLNDSTL